MPSRPRRPSWSAWSAAGPPRPRRRPPRRSPGRRFAFEAERLGSRITVDVRVRPRAGRAPARRAVAVGARRAPAAERSDRAQAHGPRHHRPDRDLPPSGWKAGCGSTPRPGRRCARSAAAQGSDDYAQWFVFGREGVFRRQHEPPGPRPGGRAARELDARERERLRRSGRRRPLPVAGRDLDAGLPHVELGRAGQLRARPAVRLPQAPASPRALPGGAAGAGRLRLPGATAEERPSGARDRPAR